MKDIRKTKAQLIDELGELRQRLATAETNIAAFQQGERRFQAMCDGLADTAYQTDTQGNLIYANEFSEKLTGRPVTEIIGKPFLPLFTPESQKVATAVYQQTLRGENPEYELTFTTGRTCLFRNRALRDQNGQITGVIGIARDITAQKHAREALHESEGRYHRLFNRVPVGLYRTTPTGQLLDANPALVRMFGYPDLEALLVKNTDDLYVHSQERSQRLHELDKEDVILGAELQVQRCDGTIIWVRDNARAIRDDNGQVLYYEGSLEDIT
ncbi:MAG: PAS domain-containing protein, partial [Planctomycetota bacterium]